MADQSITSDGRDSGLQALPKYEMKDEKVGKAVIITNINVKDLPPRNGAKIDEENFKSLFESLNFEVNGLVYENKTKADMKKIIEKVASEDHSAYNCFALAISSHGSKGVVFGTDGPIDLIELLQPLKANRCEQLRSKPKLIFIQSCRGSGNDKGVSSKYENDADDDDDKTEEDQSLKIIREMDFLYSFCTAYGYRAYRNICDGSQYVVKLKECLQEDKNILTALTMLNRVMKDLSFTGDDMKQISTFTHTLTKQLILG